ncbi:ABC transporter permease [Chelativorans sp. Marseille-P2723]|uniref:ABC transporter permease n=1 Tax=Chelativorans sp. Marseille-P2723 TaxID=2709133 RepID=UPI001FEDEE73|nr:ABC transporter permease [Chelativorans sp. Marseille-P2723]
MSASPTSATRQTAVPFHFLSGPLPRYVLRRLSQAVLVLLLVIVGSFFLLKMAPGDLVDVLAGNSDMTAEQMAALRTQYGLDQPLLVQLFLYMKRLVTLDFGYSPLNAAPVLDVIMQRWPVTAILVASSVVVSMTLGALLGVVSARNAGKPIDLAISMVMLLFYATPSFVIAICFILFFSVFLGVMPIAGFATVGTQATGLAYAWDVAKHLAMPVAALCTFYIAIYGRIGRAAMLEVLKLDYVRTARAKGISERRVIYVHALRNAMLPLVTMAGLQVSALVGGAVLIETIFGLPGMGRTAFDAVFERDTNLLLGVLFISSLSVVVVNFIIDLLYMVLDPRVELT